jgi:hypothetical protein
MTNVFEGDNPFLGVVFANPTVPTVPNVFYSVHPVILTGSQVEGGGLTTVPISSVTDLVLVLGTTPCVAGDQIVYYRVENRWVSQRFATGGGTTIVTIPGCPCTGSPECIGMTVTDPSGNNQIFQNAILKYGPTPSALLPVVFTPTSYLSTTTFFDPILNVDFFYFLTCTINSYVLTRVYVSSPFGSPFRDSVRYKWVPGFPGNDCGPSPPFAMTNGQIFLGGDPVRGHTELHGVASPC